MGGTGDVLTRLVAAFLTKAGDHLETAVAPFVNWLAVEEGAVIRPMKKRA